MDNLLINMFDIDAVKLGSFKLKTGIMSPFYFDLRVIISYPQILAAVVDEMGKIMDTLDCDLICGVPYTALPIASGLCLKRTVPMVLKRLEAKSYGTKKLIEGSFSQGQKCLIIEDVITSGSSVLETAIALRKVGLVVENALVFMDREQGGQDNLLRNGIKALTVTDISKLLTVLDGAKKISAETLAASKEYLEKNRHTQVVLKSAVNGAASAHPMVNQLYEIIQTKQSNICLAVDVQDTTELLQVVGEMGPKICMLKTHCDIIAGFDAKTGDSLRRLADAHNFLIMEDRKFADIGSMNQRQFTSEMFSICQWADIITAHSLPGTQAVQAFKQESSRTGRSVAVALVAEMSCSGNLFTTDYTKRTVQMGESNSDLVIGFVSQSRLTDSQHFIHFTPGVRLVPGEGENGQQYRSVEDAISSGSDVIIVGSGILHGGGGGKMGETLEQYRRRGYDAWLAQKEK